MLADDPLLTARDIDGARQPLRVVFDRQARLPLDSQLLRTLDVVAGARVVAPDAARRARRPPRGRRRGRSSPTASPAALAELGRRGVTSLFLEGGRTLAAAFADAGEVDESRIFVAPVLLGGAERLTALDPGAEDTLIETRFKEW